MKKPKRAPRGFILAGVIALLVILATIIPLVVMFSQREAAWTAKQAQSTAAFHLAEAGVEKAYLTLSLSTLTWVNLQTTGAQITRYHFDYKFADVDGGDYALSITSGPLAQQATIISIGRDKFNKEVRAVKAVYANGTLGNVAIMGGNGVDVSGNNLTVEWGAIVSPGPITPNGELHPSYYSADNISTLDTNGSALPNCDSPNCWWWHSYYKDIPPLPTIDFNFYKSSAITSGASPCGGSYYTNGNRTGACSDTSGKAYYVEGNWTDFDGPIKGSVIVMGSMTTPNGVMHGSAINAKVPQQAWKQYCNDWAFYKSEYETTNTAAQCPGIYSTYLSAASLTYAIDPVVNGLLYVGGDFTGPNGGGNTTIAYGVMVVNGTVNLNSNSNCTIYYNGDISQSLQTTKINLTRLSWRDYLTRWPSGL